MADVQSLVVELSLDSRKFLQGLSSLRGGGGSGGRYPQVQQSAQKAISGGAGVGSGGGIISQALNLISGEVQLGQAVNYVSNYGLTTLANTGIPGLSHVAQLGRGLGATFAGTNNASENYLGVTNKFAQNGIALDDQVKSRFARIALAKEQFVQTDQLKSKEIFQREATGENGISSPATDAAADALVDALNSLTDILKSAYRSSGAGSVFR